MTGDYTAHVYNGYARPSGASTFVGTDLEFAELGLSSPAISDPNTAVASSSVASGSALGTFSFVVGLFLLTMWLESGKKGGLL
jgi:hypothetical protein